MGKTISVRFEGGKAVKVSGCTPQERAEARAVGEAFLAAPGARITVVDNVARALIGSGSRTEVEFDNGPTSLEPGPPLAVEASVRAMAEIGPRPTSCACKLPGGQEPKTMQRRRACQAATTRKAPCGCGCHRPGHLHHDFEGHVRTTPS